MPFYYYYYYHLFGFGFSDVYATLVPRIYNLVVYQSIDKALPGRIERQSRIRGLRIKN